MSVETVFEGRVASANGGFIIERDVHRLMPPNELTESLQETITVFEMSGDPGEPMTTNEVTDNLAVGRRSTYTRLEKLADRDLLKTKKAGARGRVWWRPVEMITDNVAPDGSEDELDRERALRRAYETIANPTLSFAEQIDELLAVVKEAVGTDYATFSRVQDAEYLFEAVVAPDDANLQAGDRVPLETTNCERVVESEQTLILNDIDTDAPELADRAGNAEWGISCYLGAPVLVDREVYGSFCFYDMEARIEEFSDWEVTFVELLSNWVGNELDRQRHTNKLAALNSLNEVVQETTQAVIEQSTREQIEATVCEHLAATESYRFAWIGGVDSTFQMVTVRTEVGAGEYLDDISISITPDDDRSDGPAGRALQTSEIQTVQDVQNDPENSPGRGPAEEYGFQSLASIPIVHEETVYGVLNVYADRPYAFEGQERTVLSQLGETVGHAIAALERKRALMSDEVVELGFYIPDILDAYADAAAPDGTITFNETVPVGDGEYLVYGSATEDARDGMSALVEAVPHWKTVTFRGEDDGRFELRFSKPSMLSVIASLGGSVKEAVIEDGDYSMTLHLSPGADVRQVIDAVEEAYPTAEIVPRRQITQEHATAEQFEHMLTEDLTDRQHAVLQAAYHSGFFERPRKSSGADLAESLGVSPPTFHTHLRKAEQKIFNSLLATSATNSGQETAGS